MNVCGFSDQVFSGQEINVSCNVCVARYSHTGAQQVPLQSAEDNIQYTESNGTICYMAITLV